MKTKLTLTIRKDIIRKAKLKAKERGVSLSRLFEEVFDSKSAINLKTSEQIAGEKLLNSLEKRPSVNAKSESDKEVFKKHII